MKKYINILLLVLIGVIMLIMCVSCKGVNDISIDKKSSYFSDYIVKNDKVYIRCYITLTNTFETEKSVTLSAKLPEDVRTGLLKNETVKALDEKGEEIIFVLPPNTSESLEVIFVGDYAGFMQKNNRNLPEICIKMVE